jgi:NAD(P)-dependent dehydrogenase (short-subunit alcohol dehydrogenase family)
LILPLHLRTKGSIYSQFFPPNSSWIEADVEAQDGKVFIVTGGASGIGYELVKKLSRKGGKGCIVGRSEVNARIAISGIQSAVDSCGGLEVLFLQLDGLSCIKALGEAFKKKESKLHALWHNTEVSHSPLGSVSERINKLQLATNCLGPFILTQLLFPLFE